MHLYNIAVFQPDGNGATWTQKSSWAAGQKPNNLVFMNNLGGTASGEWSSTFEPSKRGDPYELISAPLVCQGNSQSYANGALTAAVATPNAEIVNGFLDQDHEMVRPLYMKSQNECTNHIACIALTQRRTS